MKTPIHIITRSTRRNQLRAKYGNKGMRDIWTGMQQKKYGQKAYTAMRHATDPRKRHSIADIMA